MWRLGGNTAFVFVRGGVGGNIQLCPLASAAMAAKMPSSTTPAFANAHAVLDSAVKKPGAAMAPKNWDKLCASLRQRYGSGPSGIAMGEVELRFFVEIWEHVTGERFEDAVAISRAESLRMLGQVRTSPPV